MQRFFCVGLVAGSYPGKETRLRKKEMSKKSYHINFVHPLLSTNWYDVYLILLVNFTHIFHQCLQEQTCNELNSENQHLNSSQIYRRKKTKHRASRDYSSICQPSQQTTLMLTLLNYAVRPYAGLIQDNWA